MKPTEFRALGTQNLNSSPFRFGKLADRRRFTRRKATCLDKISIIFSPLSAQEAFDDFLIKSIVIDVIVLPIGVLRNRLRHD